MTEQDGAAPSMRWSGIRFDAPRSLIERTFSNASATPTILLDNIHGNIVSGEMLAIMGPSGAGKSTLLDILSGRVTPTAGTIEWAAHASPSADVEAASLDNSGILTSYVEQHDTLLGVLTVRETLYYSAKLSMPKGTSEDDVNACVQTVLNGLGLASVANNTIGTPIKRGISGGQKRRVTIGCSLVAMPRVLFLDEPTSGLDIHTAYEVMFSIAKFAQQYRIAVCATIHSPNRDIFHLFGRVMLLARGRTVYYGPTLQVEQYFAELGEGCPAQTNAADHMLRVVSDESYAKATNDDDVEKQSNSGRLRGDVKQLSALWQARVQKQGGQEYFGPSDSPRVSLQTAFRSASQGQAAKTSLAHSASQLGFATWILTKRNVLNYRRNLLAYGVRFAMYIGMGVLLATVWVNLAKTDTRINDRLSVHFFSVAFLGFMSVAGIPSFLEERGVLRRERGNGLYGPAPFTLANTLVTMPFLFACALVFAVIMYWSIGLHSGAVPFLRWLVFLYLGVLAAEMQSLLVAAVLPIFVAALAVAAFFNGFWMTTQGYFIRTDNLPRFWYYWAHFINYETYALALLARTDLSGLTFKCAVPGQCSFPSAPRDPNTVLGQTVIDVFQFSTIGYGAQAAILISIIFVYRLMFYVVLRLQKA